MTVNGSSKIDLDLGGSLEIGVGSSIANGGEIELTGNSQIRGDISNAGVLRLIDSGVTRGVTLLADSQMFADNSSVASLVQQADAELLFELRGASNFDNLSATGAATLGGDLVVSLAGGFAPALGAQFTILSAASVSGPFATEDFSAAPLGSGLAWDVLYSSTSVTLKVVAAIPGDYNNNGTVDAADYVVWRKNVAHRGHAPQRPHRRHDRTTQYNSWRANFGANCRCWRWHRCGTTRRGTRANDNANATHGDGRRGALPAPHSLANVSNSSTRNSGQQTTVLETARVVHSLSIPLAVTRTLIAAQRRT